MRLIFSIALAACLVSELASGSHAQSINWGPSVTSLNFGGNGHFGGVSPSVTSMGFGQIGGGFRGTHSGFFSQSRSEPFDGTHHRRPAYPVWGGYYAYPVIIDPGDAYLTDPSHNIENPEEYKGGPTIFDRRGSGRYAAPGGISYQSTASAEKEDMPPIPALQATAAVAPQPQTVLIFKDGHQSEIQNYAIVGSTLYDFSGGKRRKIALSELDLSATVKDNDDRGVDFEVPACCKSN